jgi:hypothetical protein
LTLSSETTEKSQRIFEWEDNVMKLVIFKDRSEIDGVEAEGI